MRKQLRQKSKASMEPNHILCFCLHIDIEYVNWLDN